MPLPRRASQSVWGWSRPVFSPCATEALLAWRWREEGEDCVGQCPAGGRIPGAQGQGGTLGARAQAPRPRPSCACHCTRKALGEVTPIWRCCGCPGAETRIGSETSCLRHGRQLGMTPILMMSPSDGQVSPVAGGAQEYGGAIIVADGGTSCRQPDRPWDGVAKRHVAVMQWTTVLLRRSGSGNAPVPGLIDPRAPAPNGNAGPPPRESAGRTPYLPRISTPWIEQRCVILIDNVRRGGGQTDADGLTHSPP